MSAPEYPGAQEVRTYLAQMAYEADLRPLTLENYGRDLRAFAVWLAGQQKNFDGVDRRLLESYLRELGQMIAPSSLARHLSSLRGFFQWRVLENISTINPAEDIDGPKLPRHLPGVLSVEEVEMLIGSAVGDEPWQLRDRAMLETAYSCGLRVSELVGLRRRDVQLESELVRVLGKGGKERWVPLGERAQDAIKAYLYNGRLVIRGKDKDGKIRP
ncbi:site-specific tyrosine recombinase XerD, partial [candidate division KSB1 bacterium]